MNWLEPSTSHAYASAALMRAASIARLAASANLRAPNRTPASSLSGRLDSGQRNRSGPSSSSAAATPRRPISSTALSTSVSHADGGGAELAPALMDAAVVVDSGSTRVLGSTSNVQKLEGRQTRSSASVVNRRAGPQAGSWR